MPGRHRLLRILGFLVGLQTACHLVWAQNLGGPAARQPSSAWVHQFVGSGNEFYYGVMGQVAKPGVYALDTPQPQLVDLIRHAGGLTQKATNQIRIARQGNTGQFTFYSPTLNYPLMAGDIVVADGPIASQRTREIATPLPNSETQSREPDGISSSDFSAGYQHVALVNVLDRPVVLPLPKTHANLNSILSYLRQDSLAATDVRAVPVGPSRYDSQSRPPALDFLQVPTVLYFNPRRVERDRLPDFPPVYRPGRLAVAPTNLPKQLVPPPPSPPARIPQLVPPAPSRSESSEPELIVRIRESENRLPTPQLAEPEPAPKNPAAYAGTDRRLVGLADSSPKVNEREEASETPRIALVPDELHPVADEDSRSNSWWPYLGMFVILLACVGIFAKLRRPPGLLEATASWRNHKPAPSPNIVGTGQIAAALEPEPFPARSPSILAERIKNDELLSALVFNQLPVRHETDPPMPAASIEEKPTPRKVFRVDPPEALRTTSVTGPYLVKRPQPATTSRTATKIESPQAEPPPPASIGMTPGTEASKEEAAEPASLLDRVLRQVNQSRAA